MAAINRPPSVLLRALPAAEFTFRQVPPPPLPWEREFKLLRWQKSPMECRKLYIRGDFNTSLCGGGRVFFIPAAPPRILLFRGLGAVQWFSGYGRFIGNVRWYTQGYGIFTARLKYVRREWIHRAGVVCRKWIFRKKVQNYGRNIRLTNFVTKYTIDDSLRNVSWVDRSLFFTSHFYHL